MEDLGLRLKLMRKARDMTQAELARAVGVSRREVQNWEAGKRDARQRLPQIAEALACTEADLLDIDRPILPPHNPRFGGGGGSNP
jgi:transcriptional regulator with XRE-family HTH domain